MRAAFIALSFALGALSCDGPGDERSAFLEQALFEDNRFLVERTPDDLAAKFARMATGPYAFMRGTLGLFLRDAANGEAAFGETAFGLSGARDVWLVGDPHLENVGTYSDADERMVLEYNDFDASTFGPFIYDLRRLALSVEVALLEVGASVPVRDEALRRTVVGYTRAVARAAKDDEPAPWVLDTEVLTDTISVDLIRRARADGRDAEELSDYTTFDTDGRRFEFGLVEPAAPEFTVDELVPVSTEERQLVETLLRGYRERLETPGRFDAPAFALLDVARRLGAGVSSYPLLRFYALLEGPTDKPRDDWIIELKEVGGAPQIPMVAGTPQRAFASNATRLVASNRVLHATRDSDPLLAAVDLPPFSFRVRHRTKYQKGFEMERLIEKFDEKKWNGVHVAEFGARCGELLGRAHAYAPRADARVKRAALGDALASRVPELVGETQAFARRYAARVLEDHALFVALRAADGPLLGWR
jgi:uncharacterized protein (DUF2252 family)